MTRTAAFLALATALLSAASIAAAEPKVQRDIPYAQPTIERNTLDVYTPADGDKKDRPIVFWIHGGGWQQGDKTNVQNKPQALVDKGFVFVSTNYRLLP